MVVGELKPSHPCRNKKTPEILLLSTVLMRLKTLSTKETSKKEVQLLLKGMKLIILMKAVFMLVPKTVLQSKERSKISQNESIKVCLIYYASFQNRILFARMQGTCYFCSSLLYTGVSQSLAAATGFRNTKILQFKVSIDNFMHSAMTALDLKPMKLLPK